MNGLNFRFIFFRNNPALWNKSGNFTHAEPITKEAAIFLLSSLSSPFLSYFQRYGFTIIEKYPAISIFSLPVFLYFFPIFPFHFYILSNLVYPSGSGSSISTLIYVFFFPERSCIKITYSCTTNAQCGKIGKSSKK